MKGLNKIIIVISILPFFMLGCEKKVSNASKMTNSTMVNKQTGDSIEKSLKVEKNTEKLSLTLSCGSGCAMTYNASKITKEGLNISVTFTVDIYIDEAESDTYEETYIFSYDKLFKLKKIIKEGDESDDFLKTQSIDNQKSFTDFAENLVQNERN